MFILYNILQLVFLLVFFPFIILFVITSRKYRNRVPSRLGFGLSQEAIAPAAVHLNFWIHALSVGEVTSAVPLIDGIRRSYPDSKIVVSVTTRTGRQVADKLLKGLADHIIDGPLDLLPVVNHFINCIEPDIFILVETDFWPNILACLQKQGVPTLLVNGRISKKSMTRYKRMRLFFTPMFQSFTSLSMQTAQDRDNMMQLGIPSAKLPILGNLKFATFAYTTPDSQSLESRFLPQNRIILIAGSTHSGEEQILIECYIQLRKLHPELFLVIAPRDPRRTSEVLAIADEHNLSVLLRSANTSCPADIFLLDTIGELVEYYALADIAFVGGSLVNKGGHNPIEPAAMGIPVIFGPDMSDFSEIAETLILEGGGMKTSNLNEMSAALSHLLRSPGHRVKTGQKARQCVLSQSDIIANHIALIDRLL